MLCISKLTEAEMITGLKKNKQTLPADWNKFQPQKITREKQRGKNPTCRHSLTPTHHPVFGMRYLVYSLDVCVCYLLSGTAGVH